MILMDPNARPSQRRDSYLIILIGREGEVFPLRQTSAFLPSAIYLPEKARHLNMSDHPVRNLPALKRRTFIRQGRDFDYTIRKDVWVHKEIF